MELSNCPAETGSRGRAKQWAKSFGCSEVAGCIYSYRRGGLQNRLWPTAADIANKTKTKKPVAATSQAVAAMTVAKASYNNGCCEGRRNLKPRSVSCKASCLEMLKNHTGTTIVKLTVPGNRLHKI